MGQPQENGNFDPDILKCKDDILRARQAAKSDKKDDSRKPAVNSGGNIEKFVIPAFDLKGQILSDQRRVSSTARKGPGPQKTEADHGIGAIRELSEVAEDYTQIEGQPEAGPGARGNETERIIAEIVAKDIERLCGGIS